MKVLSDRRIIIKKGSRTGYLAAAQGGVFEDVRDAGGILRHGQECDHEGIVRVVSSEVDMPGAGNNMAVFLEFQSQSGNGIATQVLKGWMGHILDR